MQAEPPKRTTDAVEDEYIISLGDLLQVIWRRLWVIVLIAVLCAGLAVGYSITRTPQYESTIKILVGQEQGTDSSGSLGSDVQGLEQLTQTVADLVNSRPVAEATIQRLGLEEESQDFLTNVSVEQVPNTQVVEVSYRDPDPESAQQIANTVGEVFSEQVSEVSPGANAITATVWERAIVPEDPVSPNPLRDGLLALMLGLMLGTGVAFLLEYLDDSWRSPEEAEQVSGVPTFGMVPAFKAPKDKKKSRG